MESLGLQAVTLSDGTTAYIQQAVKGNGSFGLQSLKVSWLTLKLVRLIKSALTASELSYILYGCFIQEASSYLLDLHRRVRWQK